MEYELKAVKEQNQILIAREEERKNGPRKNAGGGPR
jgi:hypothetical protein